MTRGDLTRDFDERVETAVEALRAGKASVLAYVVGVDVEDVARVGGTTSDRLGPIDDRSGV